MNHLFLSLFLLFIASSSFSAFEIHEYLFKGKFYLKSGEVVVGTVFHTNWDYPCKESYKPDEFLELMISNGKANNDTIFVSKQLENLFYVKFSDYDSVLLSTTYIKNRVYIPVKELVKAEFISRCECFSSGCSKGCVFIFELNDKEIDRIKSGTPLIGQFGEPYSNQNREASYTYLVLGDKNKLPTQQFENMLKLKYKKNGPDYYISQNNYVLLKSELRKTGHILIQLGVSDFNIYTIYKDY